MRTALAALALSAMALSACAGGNQMSDSSPTGVQRPTTPSFSTPEPTMPRANQGGGNGGSTGNSTAGQAAGGAAGSP